MAFKRSRVRIPYPPPYSARTYNNHCRTNLKTGTISGGGRSDCTGTLSLYNKANIGGDYATIKKVNRLTCNHIRINNLL